MNINELKILGELILAISELPEPADYNGDKGTMIRKAEKVRERLQRVCHKIALDNSFTGSIADEVINKNQTYAG